MGRAYQGRKEPMAKTSDNEGQDGPGRTRPYFDIRRIHGDVIGQRVG